MSAVDDLKPYVEGGVLPDGTVPKDKKLQARLFNDVRLFIDKDFDENSYHIRLLGTDVKGDKKVRVLSAWYVPMQSMVDNDRVSLTADSLTVGIVEEVDE